MSYLAEQFNCSAFFALGNCVRESYIVLDFGMKSYYTTECTISYQIGGADDKKYFNGNEAL